MQTGYRISRKYLKRFSFHIFFSSRLRWLVNLNFSIHILQCFLAKILRLLLATGNVNVTHTLHNAIRECMRKSMSLLYMACDLMTFTEYGSLHDRLLYVSALSHILSIHPTRYLKSSHTGICMRITFPNERE